MRNRLCLLGVALALAGCGPTSAQVEGTRIKGVFASQGAEAKACAIRVNSNPAYAPIAAHLSLSDAEHPTMLQLSDAEIPSRQDVALVGARHDEMMACRTLFINTLQETIPAAVPVAEDMYYRGDQITLRLVRRQTSWGTANEENQRNVLSHKAALLAAGRQVDAQLQAAHQAEMAQRAALAGAIADAAADAATAAADSRHHR
jgi:hypothetical protein